VVGVATAQVVQLLLHCSAVARMHILHHVSVGELRRVVPEHRLAAGGHKLDDVVLVILNHHVIGSLDQLENARADLLGGVSDHSNNHAPQLCEASRFTTMARNLLTGFGAHSRHQQAYGDVLGVF